MPGYLCLVVLMICALAVRTGGAQKLPAVLSATPAVLSVAGGERISLRIANANSKALPTVLIGGTACGDMMREGNATDTTTTTIDVSCLTPPGFRGGVALTVFANGLRSSQTSVFRVDYRVPEIASANVSWGTEGYVVRLEGRGFSPHSQVLCRTGNAQRALLGTYLSPAAVECPIGQAGRPATYPMTSPKADGIFVSQDGGVRWTTDVLLNGVSISWAGGLSSPPRGGNRPPIISVGVLLSAEASTCSRAVQAALAQLNQDTEVLPGTQLEAVAGYYGANVHANETLAVLEATKMHEAGVLAIVGPGRTSVALEVSAKASTILSLPTIGSYTMGDTLSSTVKHPYFLRNSPTNKLYSEAVLRVAIHHGWRLLSIFTSDDPYSSDLGNAIARSATSREMLAAHSTFRRISSADGDDGSTTRAQIQSMVARAATQQPPARIFILSAFESRECAMIIGEIAERAATDANVANRTLSSSIETALKGYAFILDDPCAKEETFRLLQEKYGPSSGFTPGRGALNVALADRPSTRTELSDNENAIWNICSDSMLLVGQALEQGLATGELQVGKDGTLGKSQRPTLLRFLRSTTLRAGVQSGTGSLSFNNNNNDRSSDTLAFGLFNAIQRSETGEQPSWSFMGTVTADAVTVQQGQVVMWPGNYSGKGPPPDRDSSYYPEKVAVLLYDDRPVLRQWVLRAFAEINADTTLLPFTQLVGPGTVQIATSSAKMRASLDSDFGRVINQTRADGAAVAATIIRGSTSIIKWHDYAASQGILLVSPRAAAAEAESSENFPLYQSTGFANDLIVRATVQTLQNFGLRKITLLRGFTPQFDNALGNSMQRIAKEAGIEVGEVNCEGKALNETDWAEIYQHSPVLVITAYRRDMGTCLHALAASGQAGFQIISPYFQRRSGDARFGIYDDEVRTIVNGTIGVSGVVRLIPGTPRADSFQAFRSGEPAWRQLCGYDTHPTSRPPLLYCKARNSTGTSSYYPQSYFDLYYPGEDCRIGTDLQAICCAQVTSATSTVSPTGYRCVDAEAIDMRCCSGEQLSIEWAPPGTLPAASIPGDAIQLVDSVYAIAKAVDTCLKAGLWYNSVRGINDTRAAELKSCMRSEPFTGLQGTLRWMPGTNEVLIDSGFTLQNFIRPEDASAVRIETIGTVLGSQTTVRVCPSDAVRGIQYVGDTCLESVEVPVLQEAVAINATAIRIRWSHAAPKNSTVLDGFVVTAVLFESTSTTIKRRASVDRRRQSLIVPVDPPSLLPGKSSSSNSDDRLVQGETYLFSVRARYARDQWSDLSSQRSVCIGQLNERNTCGCSDEEFNSRGQPHTPPEDWGCRPCPPGAICKGMTYSSIRSQRGKWLALPTCSKQNHGAGQPISGGCSSGLAVLDCPSGLPGLPACPGNFSAAQILATLETTYNGTAPSQCAAGYDGFECKACQAGFSRDPLTLACGECTSSGTLGVLLGLVGLLVLVIIVATAVALSHELAHRRNPHEMKLKGLLSWIYRGGGVNRLKDLFSQVDTDGNGTLNQDEFFRSLSDVPEGQHQLGRSELQRSASFKRAVSFRHVAASSSEQAASAAQPAEVPHFKTHHSHHKRHESSRVTRAESDKIFDAIDADNSGDIDFQEFLAYLTHNKASQRLAYERKVSATCFALHAWNVWRDHRFRTAFKMVIKYIQVLNSITINFPEVAPMLIARLSWIGGLNSMASASVDFDVLSIGFDCISGPRFYPRLVRATILPISGIIICGTLGFTFGLAAQQPSIQSQAKRKLKQRLHLASEMSISLAGKIIFLTYPSVSRTILSALSCYSPLVGTTTDQGGRDYGAWLKADPSVSCTEDSLGFDFKDGGVSYNAHVLPYAITMLVLFSLGIPAFIFSLLGYKRWPVNLLYDISADGKPLTSLAGKKFRTFYWMFTPPFWFFGPVDLLRHFFLTALLGVFFVGGKGGAAAFGALDVQARLSTGALFSLVFLVLFLAQSVYAHKGGTLLASLTHFSYICLFGYMFLIKESTVDPQDASFGAREAFVCIVIFLPFVVAAFETVGTIVESVVDPRRQQPNKRYYQCRRKGRLPPKDGESAPSSKAEALELRLEVERALRVHNHMRPCILKMDRDLSSIIERTERSRHPKSFNQILSRDAYVTALRNCVLAFHRALLQNKEPVLTWKQLIDMEVGAARLSSARQRKSGHGGGGGGGGGGRGAKVADSSSNGSGGNDAEPGPNVTLALSDALSETLMAPRPALVHVRACVTNALCLYRRGRDLPGHLKDRYVNEFINDEIGDYKALIEWATGEDALDESKGDNDAPEKQQHEGPSGPEGKGDGGNNDEGGGATVAVASSKLVVRSTIPGQVQFNPLWSKLGSRKEVAV